METETDNELTSIWEKIIAGEREPPHDDSIWLSDPKFAYLYAKYFRNSRWSEDQEAIFCNDMQSLYAYAFWIHASLGQEVPETLHNIVLMKCVEKNDKDKEWCELYFKNIKKKSG